MGLTREKKPSKRVQKVAARTEMPNHADAQPPIQVPEPVVDHKAPTSESNSYLAPSILSSRASRSSFRSLGSSTSSTTKPEADRYEPSRVEVRSTPNKGYALFAASHIPKGAMVLAEIPAIRLTAADEEQKHLAENTLLEKFDDLSIRTQKHLKKLHNTQKDGFSKLRSIYHSNCYNLDGSRSDYGGSCIGLMASRINHSCLPNVQFNFHEVVPDHLFDNDSDSDACLEGKKYDSANGVMIFRALKAIPADREILSNYESVYAIRSQRQSQLQTHYGFRCDCNVCTVSNPFWMDDDDHRLEMIKYRGIVDATEARFVVKKAILKQSPEIQTYYLRRQKAKDGKLNTTDLEPLTVNDCGELVGVLTRLEGLLVKRGLVGKELERVRREKDMWIGRARACVWSTESSC